MADRLEVNVSRIPVLNGLVPLVASLALRLCHLNIFQLILIAILL